TFFIKEKSNGTIRYIKTLFFNHFAGSGKSLALYFYIIYAGSYTSHINAVGACKFTLGHQPAVSSDDFIRKKFFFGLYLQYILHRVRVESYICLLYRCFGGSHGAAGRFGQLGYVKL